jgi:hypothetical protein
MYSTCLHCHASLGANEAIEHFPVGQRLAFDAAKGRLWVVCPQCGRWNLTPIEERWEAVEECEREFRRHRLREQTDNIGLVKLAGGAVLIRIGRPLRPEFAAWRYGRVFGGRFKRRIGMIAGLGAVTGAGVYVLSGSLAAPIIAAAPVTLLPLGYLWLMLGLQARGHLMATRVVGDDGKPFRVVGADLDHTKVIAQPDEPLRLMLKHSYGRQELAGDRATRALATILAHVNRGGGSSGTVRDAAVLIADAGDPARAIARIASEQAARTSHFETRAAAFARATPGRSMADVMRKNMERQQRAMSWNRLPATNPGALHRLPRVQRLALEMALHETTEQHALDDELNLLERAWREAEEIAAISDDLLTPEHVRRRIDSAKGL